MLTCYSWASFYVWILECTNSRQQRAQNLVRFPAPMPFYSHLSGTPEASQPTFRRFLHWRTVVVFIGHLIRQWAHSMSCRSTSKAMWQHSIKMTRRDMPGSCRTASSGQKSGWTSVFWTMTLMISLKIKIKMCFSRFKICTDLSCCTRLHPERSLCHATRVARCRQTSSSWRNW